MKRLPRKIKKLAKKSIQYGLTDDFIAHPYLDREKRFPPYGVLFEYEKKKSKYSYIKILFGKKMREAYEEGMFNF
jgi:hypothetical protein